GRVYREIDRSKRSSRSSRSSPFESVRAVRVVLENDSNGFCFLNDPNDSNHPNDSNDPERLEREGMSLTAWCARPYSSRAFCQSFGAATTRRIAGCSRCEGRGDDETRGPLGDGT